MKVPHYNLSDKRGRAEPAESAYV